MSYSFRAGPGWNSVPSWSCSNAVYKPVWHIPLLSVQWINSWWWTDELSETCRVSWQNKFVKLVHLDGFITKKFVTMHGHMNVKLSSYFFKIQYYSPTHTWVFQIGLLPSHFPHTTYALSISYCLILSPKYCLVKGTNQEALHYTIFSSLQLVPPS